MVKVDPSQEAAAHKPRHPTMSKNRFFIDNLLGVAVVVAIVVNFDLINNGSNHTPYRKKVFSV
jgi:hypothetical protein